MNSKSGTSRKELVARPRLQALVALGLPAVLVGLLAGGMVGAVGDRAAEEGVRIGETFVLVTCAACGGPLSAFAVSSPATTVLMGIAVFGLAGLFFFLLPPRTYRGWLRLFLSSMLWSLLGVIAAFVASVVGF